MKKLRPLDFVIFLICAAAVFYAFLQFSLKQSSFIKVSAAGSEYEYSLEKDGIYTVKGSAGPVVFEIKDGQVRIVESSCPNKTCVLQGWSLPLVCLPNNVIITSDGSGVEFDAVAQ